MFRIYFEDYYNRERHLTEIGHCKAQEELWPIMKTYLEKVDPDWKVHYIRSWGENGNLTYDFGKYNQFFTTEWVDVEGEE